MKFQKVNLIVLLGLISSTFSYANLPPYKTSIVEEFKSGNVSNNLAKYRIVLSESTNGSNINATVKNITLCSLKKCYSSLSVKILM